MKRSDLSSARSRGTAEQSVRSSAVLQLCARQTAEGVGDTRNSCKEEDRRKSSSGKWILGPLAVMVLAACATTSRIETNKNAAYTEVLTRLYIVMDIGDWMISRNTSSDQNVAWKESRFDGALIASLEKKLQERGIVTKSAFVTALDIDPHRTAKDRTDFHADREMTVRLPSFASLDGKHLLKGLFDATIHDTSDEATNPLPIVWRARLVVDGGQVYIGMMVPLPIDPEKVADAIIAGLQADRLIPGLQAKAN